MSFKRCIAHILLAVPLAATAGVFSVSPIRVDLAADAKAGSVTVTNDGSRLPLKVSLMRWTQDAEGVDRYEPASDLVYFPRELTVEKNSSRTIRVLSSALPAGPEQAYRLFIEEGLPAQADAPKASGFSVLVKFGVAVYVHAKEVSPALSIEANGGGPHNGQLRIRNAGTGHAFVKELQGPGLDFANFKPRYVLAGSSFPLNATATAEACSKGVVDVSISTAEGQFKVPLRLSTAFCK